MDGTENSISIDVSATLERIRQKLLDLTLRNRLLNYTERARSIRIVDELPDAVFHDLVHARRGFEFRPTDAGGAIDLSPELPEAPADPEAVAPKHQDRFLQTTRPANQLADRLRQLAAEARRAIEETGSNTLYLAFGFLDWIDKAGGKTVRAPLILLPATLKRTRVRRADTVRYKYVLTSSEEDLEDNLCLAEKLLLDFGLVLPGLYEGDGSSLGGASRTGRCRAGGRRSRHGGAPRHGPKMTGGRSEALIDEHLYIINILGPYAGSPQNVGGSPGGGQMGGSPGGGQMGGSPGGGQMGGCREQ
ncbi:MAG: DUF4011 domain-containing protein, partial [bacterium]|nr:DUF4011 domain-containing protein [bacterium]